MSNASLTLEVCLPFRLVATALCPELRRDAEFFRWLGPGAETPAPVACIWVDDELVGWVDYGRGR